MRKDPVIIGIASLATCFAAIGMILGTTLGFAVGAGTAIFIEIYAGAVSLVVFSLAIKKIPPDADDDTPEDDT